jgi:type I restriction enzyme S subunit
MENGVRPLPPGWARTTLGEVATVLPGFGFPERLQGRRDGDFPFLKVRDISRTVLEGDTYARTADNYVTTSDCAELRARPLPAGSIVFAKIGEAIRLNRRAILAQDSLVDNNAMGALAAPGLETLFLFYYLTTLKLGDVSRATTVPSVRKSDVESLQFPLAPVPEQRRVVAKIEELFSQLDAGVEELKKAKAQLKRYRQSVLKAAFEGKLTEEWRKVHKGKASGSDAPDEDGLPGGWRQARVGDLAESIQYGYTAKAVDEPVGPKMLRITDIQGGLVDWPAVPHCIIEADELQKFRLRPGDLVFARTGATVGKSFLISGRIPEAVFASYLIRIVLPTTVVPQYVYQFFQSSSYWEQIKKGQLGIGQPNVNASVLSQISLPLAPRDEQEAIVSEVESRLSIADAEEKTIEAALKQAARLRQSILKRAFEGKLVPQDRTDEPADRLLERIRAEKAKRDALPRTKSRKGRR